MTGGAPDPDVVPTHLAAAAGLDSPDYASAIDRLAQLSALPAELASRLRPMAGFRNVLVHGYLQTDLAVVERILSEKLAELEEFADHIERYVQRPA